MSEYVRVIDIPRSRVFEVERIYYTVNFKRVNENGDAIGEGEAPYRVVRNRDGKVFKLAAFVPYGWKARDCVYLEEL